MWNVNICDYGLNDEEEYYVTYRIYDLDDKTKDYLVNTLEGKITVEDNSILFDVVFPEKIFPFKTEQKRLNSSRTTLLQGKKLKWAFSLPVF